MADDIYLGGKQIPNPKGITSKLDTDNPDLPKKRYVDMNISNPPTSSAVPKSHERPSADPFEMHGIGFKDLRHPPGHGIPKDHPAIQVSEN